MRLGDVVIHRGSLPIISSDSCGEVVEILHQDEGQDAVPVPVPVALSQDDLITIRHPDGSESGGCVRRYVVVYSSKPMSKQPVPRTGAGPWLI